MCRHVGTSIGWHGTSGRPGAGSEAQHGGIGTESGGPCCDRDRGSSLQAPGSTGRLLSLQTNLQDAGLTQQQGNRM